jgi:prephenate dehydrogenase
MWSEIIASNKTNVADWLKALSSECAGLAASIESDQADIERLFGEAQAARAKIMRT